ncbi:MAG: hypothetical protein HXX81_04825 [Campylobacterales bacterium]|nr:hypothetical protein [Campylobacterales bacterium]
MRLKRYAFFSIVLIILISFYVFTFEGGSYTIELFSIPVNLPIAIWVAIALLFIFVSSFFHMAFYSFKYYWKEKSVEKDKKNFVNFIKELVLNGKSDISFKCNDSFGYVANILKSFNLTPKFDYKSDIEEIEKLVIDLKSIKNGENIDLKCYKLDKNNCHNIENLKNQISQNLQKAVEILRKSGDYGEDVLQFAYKKVAQDGVEKDVRNYLNSINITKEIFYILMNRAKELHLTNSDIYETSNKAGCSTDDFIQLAVKLKSILNPNEMIALFEYISNKNEDAIEAYLYTLLNFEMIDKAKEILDASLKSDYLKIKAYLELKEQNKHYPLELFI